MIGPFVETGLLSPAAGLVMAILIGFAFGWFLEQGGLGNARKLAGQFYLTDLTVFKVMFSAIVTAALGLFWFGRLGVIDPALLYVPVTYVLPQLAGGVVFGLGFVMGGLCPGTSCVAASTGRIDGLALMAGMLFGVLGFNELYPVIASFYSSTPMGAATVPDLLGIPTGNALFLLTVIAIAAFVVGHRIERRLRGLTSKRG
jgi:uncharacterized membrane protein YedE/YeeE